MAETAWEQCIKEVSEANDADMYMISGRFDSPVDNEVIDCLEKNKSKQNAFLILTTFGGDADVAYRIARCFQRTYAEGKFTVFVSTVCKSAGTLVTIGGNELIMSNRAHLGPLDVQMSKPDEIGAVISGLTPVQSLAFLKQHTFELFEHYFLELISRSDYQITTKTSAEIATKMTVGMFQTIYSQLDPIKLGENHRNMMVAVDYGKRLMSKGNLRSKAALNKLTHGYPSHGFVIDREEAGTLFENVRKPSEQESKMIDLLWDEIYAGLFHKDNRGHFVAVVNFINPNIKSEEIEKQDSEQKEVESNEEQNVENIQSTKSELPESNTTAEEKHISDADKPQETDNQPSRATGD